MSSHGIIPVMERVNTSEEMDMLDEGVGLASPPVTVRGKAGQLSKGVTRNGDGMPEIARHRSRLGKMFIQRMRADFQKYGIATIEKVRKERPAAYLELIARLMPQQMEINVQHSFVDLLMEAQQRYQGSSYAKVIEAEIVRE